jgi:hypothetical protein
LERARGVQAKELLPQVWLVGAKTRAVAFTDAHDVRRWLHWGCVYTGEIAVTIARAAVHEIFIGLGPRAVAIALKVFAGLQTVPMRLAALVL